jgi:inosine-uridine nucleoside N-ribohydrolase
VIHLDTDLGGDPDDLCALALLLGSPGVELAGITTVLDRDGRRAGYVRYCLDLAGQSDIQVVAGAVASLTTGLSFDPEIEDRRFWPAGLPLGPSSPGAALDALAGSIERGAEIIAIGAMTNLAMLETARPGILREVSVTTMGGWVDPPAPGYPAWGPEMDWNVQCDARAMESVARSARLSIGTLSGAFTAHLRESDLPSLCAAGPLGSLIAQQSLAYAEKNGLPELGRRHDPLPDDLLNIHWDPSACAMALGWACVDTEETVLSPVVEDGVLRFVRDETGFPARILTRVDNNAFSARWIETVAAAHR